MSTLKFNPSNIDTSSIGIVATIKDTVKVSLYSAKVAANTSAKLVLTSAVVIDQVTKHLPERAEEIAALTNKGLQIPAAAFCGMVSSLSGKKYSREDLLQEEKEGYDKSLWEMFQPSPESEENKNSKEEGEKNKNNKE